VITQNPQQLFKLQFDPWGVKLQETINDHGMTILKKKVWYIPGTTMLPAKSIYMNLQSWEGKRHPMQEANTY